MNNDTPADAIELKPCDFCGISYTDISNRYTDNYQVHCMGCGADGPTSASLDGAITAWNTRTTSLAAQDGLVDALRYIREQAQRQDVRLAALDAVPMSEPKQLNASHWGRESVINDEQCLQIFEAMLDAIAALASIEVKSTGEMK